MGHLLLDTVIGIFEEAVNDMGGVLVGGLLNDGDLGRLLVHLGLEGISILLFFFGVNSKLLQSLILALL